MARLDELAEGIASLLASSPVPEPLKICFRGEGKTETTFFVRAVIDSCERRGTPLSAVRVGSTGADLMKLYADEPSGYQGVSILSADQSDTDVEFYRFKPDNS